LLIARKLQVPVIVGADRHQAGLLAERTFSSMLHLLDDGFQHRRLHRDFDIVLLPEEDQRGSLLPTGRLREPMTALSRADAVVLIGDQEKPPGPKTIWHARRVIELPAAAGRTIVFSGIARPGQFIESLKSSKVETAGALTFPDHHRYRQRDIDRLLDVRKQTNADSFITTEKDLINLGTLASQLSPLLSAKLRMQLESPQQAVMEIIKTIEERSGHQIQPPA
ncbi:MAG TPA: tetraacyldisaccharide 4'-kinase, partial [Blattabacteriaceae bacterium]|nr:tetraacyldisaccharide 4'-kinase [Blattabacteriaceae bacterium]